MSRPNTHQILRGEALLLALATTSVAVKWLRERLPEVLIEPRMAIPIVKAGCYIGKARTGRVYYIREVDDRPKPVWDHTWWDDRGMLHWYKSVDAKTVDLWDQIFASKARAANGVNPV